MAAAGPMAGLALLCAYTGLALATSALECGISADVRESLDHEGGYIARLAGKEWPGQTPYPTGVSR
jgi:hypothetical protein